MLVLWAVVPAQVPQPSPRGEIETLAGQIIAAGSDEDRQKLIEPRREALTQQFFQILAALAGQEKDARRGVDALKFAADLARGRSDAFSSINIHVALGTLLLRQQQPEAARKAFDEAKNFVPQVDAFAGGKSLAMIGTLYMSFGLYQDSLPWLVEAKTLLEKTTNQEGLNWLAETWRTIGIAYSETERYDEAFEALRQSENFFRKAQNPVGIAGVLSVYGTTYDFLQNYGRAKQSYLDAINLLESLKDERHKERIASVKANLGLLQTISLGEHDAALKNFDEVEKVFVQSNRIPNKEAQLARLYGNKAIALRRLGQYQSGFDYAEKAFQFFEKIDPSAATNQLAQLANAYFDLKRYDDALVKADEAITRAEDLKSKPILWTGYAARGRALAALKRDNEAKDAFDKAIATVEAMTDEAFGDEAARASYFGGFVYPYQYMVELLVRQGDYENALLYAERSKAKELLRALQSRRNDWSKGMTAAQKQEERELNEKLKTLNAELSEKERSGAKANAAEINRLTKQREDLRRERENFRIRVYKSVPKLSSRRVDVAAENPAKLAEALADDKTVGLHYVVTPETVTLFVLSKKPDGSAKVSGHLLPLNGSELARQVKKFRGFLENEPLGGFNEVAGELYKALLEPAEAELRGKQTVVIVADGALWELPFQALRNARQKYFIESHAVVYAPSFSALAQMKRVAASRPKNYQRAVLALGNPDLGAAGDKAEVAKKMGGDLKPLPQAETQVKSLGQLFPASKPAVYVRADATETRVKREAAGARIVHLAAHGILDDSSPLYSHIVLSQTGDAGREDGLLETWELMNLDLTSTEMLVLSACETARGEMRSGEGIIGLTWAAFVAGSPTTVSSQWKVDADATNLLMNKFYNNLFPAAGRRSGANRPAAMSKAKAMQTAMKQMLKPGTRYDHPAFWAGFIIVGDGQ